MLLDLWLRDKPLVQQWWARVRARPSAVETIATRIPAEAIADMSHFGALTREREAQRRQEYLALMV